MKKDSKGFIFLDWENWLDYTKNAIAAFLISLFSIVYAIVMGLVTLIVYAWKQIKRIAETYPIPTLSLLCVFLIFFAFFLFVNYSAKLKTCQMERDSVAYEKMKLEQAFVGDTIIIRGYSTHERRTKTQLIDE